MSRATLSALGVLLLVGCGSPARLEVVSDECPDNDQKIYPGVCGCAIAEERCAPLRTALVHRYMFDGVGTVAVDEVSAANGVIVNAELTGTGQLQLARKPKADPAIAEYVDLPNGIISALGSATFESWLIWETPEEDQFWERIFDFGVSTAGEDQRLDGESYLFLAPATPRTAFRNAVTEGEIILNAKDAFPTNVVFHVAVVVDQDAQELRLYLNAVDQGRVTLTEPLSTIEDVNNWLGRSQFLADSTFGGSFLEFRIYNAALTQAQLAESLAFGDSPAFLRTSELPAQVASGSLP